MVSILSLLSFGQLSHAFFFMLMHSSDVYWAPTMYPCTRHCTVHWDVHYDARGENGFPCLNPPPSLNLQCSLLPIPLHHQTLPKEASPCAGNRNSPSCKPQSGHLWWLNFLSQNHFPLSGPVSKRWEVPPATFGVGTKWWLPQDAHILILRTWEYSTVHVKGDFEDMRELRILRSGDYPGTTRVFLRGRQEAQSEWWKM